MTDRSQYQRKLSTIIAVDVCGYSRLVEQDEEMAIAAVDDCRALIAQIIGSRGGRIFNHAGDGVMAETPSAVEGVRAAFQIQRELEELNERHPNRPPLCVRIGVNIGDVVEKEDGDLVGHGVNIAARLESIAKPGETLISAAVFEQVRGTVAELFEDAGYERLKNIDVPVGVFRAISTEPTPTKSGKARRPLGISPRARLRQRRWPLIAAGLAIVAVVAIGAFFLGNGQAPAPRMERTIAVLPLANLSQDPENQYFSDGVTEEILSALVRLEDVSVIGRTSSFQFRDSDQSADVIGRRLNASHLLEGSVRRDGNRVRVSVQLVDVAKNINLWSQSYDRQLRNVFVIQEDIARDVASALRAELTVRGQEPGINIAPETYELYLRGRNLLSQRGAAIPQAVAQFETVVQREPGFADGWSALASALHVLPGYSDTPNEEIKYRVVAAAERALQIDPYAAEALAVLGAQHRRAGEWSESEKAFKQALSYEPNNVNAVYWYGEFLLSVGRMSDAVPYFEKAHMIDPLSPYTSAGVGWSRYFAGDREAAKEAFGQAWNEMGLKVGYVWEGLYSIAMDEADFEAAHQLLAEMPGDDTAVPLHQAFLGALQSNDEAGTAAVAAMFSQLASVTDFPFYWQFEAFSRLHADDAALNAAERAVEADTLDQYQALFVPSAAHLRDSPRYAALIEKLGLPTYWATHSEPDLCLTSQPRPRFCPNDQT